MNKQYRSCKSCGSLFKARVVNHQVSYKDAFYCSSHCHDAQFKTNVVAAPLQ